MQTMSAAHKYDNETWGQDAVHSGCIYCGPSGMTPELYARLWWRMRKMRLGHPRTVFEVWGSYDYKRAKKPEIRYADRLSIIKDFGGHEVFDKVVYLWRIYGQQEKDWKMPGMSEEHIALARELPKFIELVPRP